jgi:alginate O-acetyltransferase complex protein AlgI
MLFSSLVFLFLFLPLTLLLYYISPRAVKNYVLLACSLVFFAWGGVSLSAILICSIILNYFGGLLIEKYRDNSAGKFWLTVSVAINIGLLCVFKYGDFLVYNFSQLLQTEIPQPDIILPIGISFYTFHALSYLVDIYRKKTTAQRNIFHLALYICMFSQLIAGPIIRYSDVSAQLLDRAHNITKFSAGIERFLIGLSKKVLLANTFAATADAIFNSAPAELTAPLAWLGIVCYSLQIYCDFAGYSDMAIGLGKMFGFTFMENFNFPYMALSVREFWRRWHMSLSGFFRDYVYVPLGGNRRGNFYTYRNLLIVFFLTGFWHGASWTFVAWGLFHGAFMVLEKLGLEKLLNRVPKWTANLYTLIAVMFAWVLFRCETFEHALAYWRGMFTFVTTQKDQALFFSHCNLQLVVALAIAFAGSFGLFSKAGEFVRTFLQRVPFAPVHFTVSILTMVVLIVLMFLCTISLVSGSYNPFIYYRF